MFPRAGLALLGIALLAASAQEVRQPEKAAGSPDSGQGKSAQYVIDPGTRIPLTLINSVSTKHAAEGDRIYLETAFPILSNGKIVIPPGSYVAGTVTQSKRPGRVKGKGELFVRFDSLTLPNGVTRDFRGRIGALDGLQGENLDRQEGKIQSESNKGGDARAIGEAAAAGASIGVIAGGAADHWGMGAGIGAAAGAAAGVMGVLLSRGPDAVLERGSTIEMVLDRTLQFEESELDFSGTGPRRATGSGSGRTPSQKNSSSVGFPQRRFPF